MTIPLADAFAQTEAHGVRPGAVRRRLAGGAIAWSPGHRPGTAYVAYPGVD